MEDLSYSPFDKTSPTANIEAVYSFLALAQHWNMRLETNEVPSAYLHAHLKNGQKHVMRITSTLCQVRLHSGHYSQEIPSEGWCSSSVRSMDYWKPESSGTNI